MARSTTRVTPQLCDALNIDQTTLPVVCALVRGSPDTIAVPLRSALDVSRLLFASKRISAAIGDLSARALTAEIGVDAVRHHLARSEKVQAKIDRNRKRMLDFARGLENDHAITRSRDHAITL